MRLMNSLGYLDRGKTQAGYTEVISRALAQLEQSLAAPKPPLRYGLVCLKGLSTKTGDNSVFIE